MKYIFFCLILFLGCDENLPPREIPSDIFEGIIEPEYILTSNENALRVRIFVKNKFDETLEGKAKINGIVEIISSRDPKIKFTAKIENANIVSAPYYNPQTNILRLNPEETMILNFTWNFITTDSVNLIKDFFHLTPDPSCTGRNIAIKESFKITGDMQVFGNISPFILNEVLFKLCYADVWVRQGLCPEINCN